MSDIAIKLENISKQYRLGTVGTNSMKADIQAWWYRMRGIEDKTLKIGHENSLADAGGEYVWALRDINLEVKKGEILGIIGKNGAGKSTLLKLLSRVTGPSTGQIKVNGRIASLLEVGTGFHGELTGRENIFLNGSILGMSKNDIHRQLDEIVEFAGIAKYIDTPVKRYSSGMYVRLGFAVAAHLNPDILIVDEVLAVGDAEFQKKAIGKMKEVSQGGGRTVLFVSHNMASISALCDNSILLNQGGIQFKGKTKDVIDKYLYLKLEGVKKEGLYVFTGKEVERKGERQYGELKKIQLMNYNNENTVIFKMGDVMKISLEIDFFNSCEDFEIGISIGNSTGVYTQYFVSGWEGVSSFQKTGKTQINITIPKVVIFPGTYFLNIWTALRGAYYDDSLNNVLSFEVKEGKVNNHNTYFERFSKNTQVYSPSTWKIQQL